MYVSEYGAHLGSGGGDAHDRGAICAKGIQMHCHFTKFVRHFSHILKQLFRYLSCEISILKNVSSNLWLELSELVVPSRMSARLWEIINEERRRDLCQPFRGCPDYKG